MRSGSDHVCATRGDGSVRCWGANDFGQLGDQGTVDRLSPSVAEGMLWTTHLALGSDHTCARSARGLVYCWGNDALGQLGDGTAGGSVNILQGVVNIP